MNKTNIITIDEPEITLENINGILNITNPNCNINFKKNNKIQGIQIVDNAEITFNLEDNATLEWNDFWTHQNAYCHIKVNSFNQTKLEWNLNIEAKTDYDITLENQICGNNNISKIIIHVVSLQNKTCKIRSLGKIMKETKENQFTEELKGLALENQTISFLPDLMVDSSEVTAIHNATLRCINELELFYLKSKGLDEITSKELIKNGFLNKKV